MESRFIEKTTKQKRGIRRVKNELNESEKCLPSGRTSVRFAKRRDQIGKEYVGFFMAIDSQGQLVIRVQRLPLNVWKF